MSDARVEKADKATVTLDEDPLLEDTDTPPSSPSPSPSVFAKFFKWFIGLAMVLLVIVSWVMLAMVMQIISQGSEQTGSSYHKPWFMSYFIGAAYALALPIWAVWHFVVNRNKPDHWNPAHFADSDYYKCAILSILGTVCRWAWYHSLPITSVSANTAIYNSSAVFVFIFSYFLLKEKITLLKVISVILSTAGVVIVSIFGQGATENGHESTWMGFVWVIISTLCWAFFLALYGKFTRDDPIKGPERSVLYLGLMGSCTLVLQWPITLVLHYTGIETFELPPPMVQYGIGINVGLDLVLNGANFIGIAFTSPLFMTVGSVLTIPTSVLADKIIQNYVLPVWAFLGMGVIMIGFILLNVDEYLRMKKEKPDVSTINGEGDPIMRTRADRKSVV